MGRSNFAQETWQIVLFDDQGRNLDGNGRIDASILEPEPQPSVGVTCPSLLLIRKASPVSPHPLAAKVGSQLATCCSNALHSPQNVSSFQTDGSTWRRIFACPTSHSAVWVRDGEEEGSGRREATKKGTRGRRQGNTGTWHVASSTP